MGKGLNEEDLKLLLHEIFDTYGYEEAMQAVKNGKFANVLYYWMTRLNINPHGWVSLDRFNIDSRNVDDVIDYINKELGTNLTNNIADADKAKYCICAKLYNPNWSGPVKRYLNSKYYPFSGVEFTMKKDCLIGFETEADAQDCLNKLSSITSRATYEDAEWIIEPIDRGWTGCSKFIKAKVNLQGAKRGTTTLLGEYYLPLDTLCSWSVFIKSYEDTFGELFR